MNNDGSSSLKTLEDWEKFLAPQVQQVQLLGEINLTAAETDQLSQLFGKFFQYQKRYGNQPATIRLLKRRYPCAFASFLVALGAHDNNSLDGYWPEVQERLGVDLPTLMRQDLGQLFEEVLVDHNLPLFPDMGGFRYVSLILVHGGIPNYSFNDYFEKMLWPAVTRPWYAGMAADELIDEWLSRSLTVFVDKPVLRFLKFGGQIALDFVDRSRELAVEYLESRLVPPAQQIGLPLRVVEAFHRWVSAAPLPPPPPSGPRLRRPEIRLDPWGEGVSIDLPPEPIPARQSQARLEWEIKLGGQVENRIQLWLERVGYNLLTPFETLLLERAVDTCDVSLLFDNQAHRTWTFDLTGPLLAFDPVRHTLLRWQGALPARPLWLLYPGDARLEFSGSAIKLEEFPPLPWGWAGFKGEVWDISQATRLTLHRPGQSPVEVPVRTDEAALRPHLVDGLRHRTFTLIKTPLYIGAPPRVRIPLVGRTSVDEELKRWQFTLVNDWPAAPSRNLRRVPLYDLRRHLTVADTYVDLALDNPQLLGPAPMGNYTLRLRGPLGRDAELSLRLLPNLALTGHERVYLPDPRYGPPTIELLIKTAPGVYLEAQTAENPCQVQPEQQQLYRIVVPPDVTEARLVALKDQPGQESIRVPLHIPLRRLRWTLTGDTDQVDSQRVNWTGHIINQSLDALEQTVAPLLLVDLGASGVANDSDRGQLGLYLVDQDDRELQQQILTRPLRDPDSVVWRFELAAFMDTIRAATAPGMRFELEYPGENGPIRQPVVNISRSIQVDQVRVHVQTNGSATLLHITWQEPVRLRHRRLRFWSLWRPWLPCHDEIIPDDAEGELQVNYQDPEFANSKYLLEFLVVDPWAGSSSASIHPPTAGTNLAVVELIPSAQRRVQIQQGLSRGAPAFEPLLERAFIQADSELYADAGKTVWEAYQWCEHATLPQLMAMARLVEQLGDRRLLTALRLKMIKPDRLQRFIDAYETGDLPLMYLNDYREQILHQTELWPLSTCEKLLKFPYEPVQIFALMYLIRRGAQAGGETILRRINNHRFSDVDGVDLFEINMDFAAQFLADHLQEPDARRLLMRLTERDPEREWPILLVQPGYFIRSCAGWGRIDQIELLGNGQPVDHFISEETGFRLAITLRPNHDHAAAKIEVLPDRHRLLFAPDIKVYRCAQSKECTFITPNQSVLYNGHNAVAHEGIGAKFEQKHSPFLSTQPVEYRLRAPQDILR